MIFTVVWDPEANEELTRLWLAASDQLAITVASDRIDQTLKRNADHQGMKLS